MGARRLLARSERRKFPGEQILAPVICPLASDVRRCLGVDGEPLYAVSRLFCAARCDRRIQRQVHDQSACASRWLLRDTARSYAGDLSEFLLSASALAV